jgi:hypothetical protein
MIEQRVATRLISRIPLVPAQVRGMATASGPHEHQPSPDITSGRPAKKQPKKEGDVSLLSDTLAQSSRRPADGQIGSVFASLSGEVESELPERFLHLKR